MAYSVNRRHPGQILVQAQVVPLALDLSTTLLVLRPTPSFLAQSGYRSSVTIRNRRNRAAEFTWRPVVPAAGILFSIRPATGAECAAQFHRHHVTSLHLLPFMNSFTPPQVRWSPTGSWTARSCGIPPFPPLCKETLTSVSTKATPNGCTVLPRSVPRTGTITRHELHIFAPPRSGISCWTNASEAAGREKHFSSRVLHSRCILSGQT